MDKKQTNFTKIGNKNLFDQYFHIEVGNSEVSLYTKEQEG